jgi:hypothetical protein
VPTAEPRNDLCTRCYQDDYHGRVPLTACACCELGDVRMLVRRELVGGLVVLCANCAQVRGRRPVTLEDLRAEILPAGDRRQGDRRRTERRVAERRLDPGLELEAADARRRDRRAA